MNKKMMRLAAIAVSLMILFACKPEPVLPTLPANSQVEAFLTAAPWKFRSLSNEDLRADDKEVLEDIYGKLTYEFYTNGDPHWYKTHRLVSHRYPPGLLCRLLANLHLIVIETSKELLSKKPPPDCWQEA
ncbi:MAG: hypothetical protein AAF135_07730 [Bacteroidota bacterium]